MTSYDDGVDPYRSLALHGQHVLLYPALASGDEPVSSLRLESIRDGIEDADLARMLIARKGVRRTWRSSSARGSSRFAMPPPARLPVGVRPRELDEVRVAALPERRGHRRCARARARGVARGARVAVS